MILQSYGDLFRSPQMREPLLVLSKRQQRGIQVTV